MKKLASLLLIAPLTLAAGACTSSAGTTGTTAISCASGTIAGQGSSAQANAVNAWIKNYQVACEGATVAYSSVGSGAGVTAFSAGTGEWAGSDSALNDTTRPKADARCATGPAINLPMVVGPIALAYNVAGVDELRLKPATIARIFAGAIKTWNDPAIVADNPNAALPATAIKTVHRQDSSGTTDNFTKFLAATDPADWTFGGGSTWTAPGGTAVKGSTGVVETISRTEGAIGYVEGSYARFYELPTALIGNAAGEYAPLTDDGAAATVADAKIAGTGGDLRLSLDYKTAASGAYPLVLVTYEIVCSKGTSALLKSFLTYAAGADGQAAATRLGYAPLPSALQAKVAAAVKGL